MKPMPSHLAPVRVTLACDEGLSDTTGDDGAIGAPQPGQAAALSETSFPHSLHLMSAIILFSSFFAQVTVTMPNNYLY